MLERREKKCSIAGAMAEGFTLSFSATTGSVVIAGIPPPCYVWPNGY